MADRIPSDHSTVESYRAALSRVGRTSRPRIELPPELDVTAGDLVRVSLGGTEYHARIESGPDGDPELRGAYDNQRLARTDGEGTNRLRAWVQAADVSIGRSVKIDVVTSGYKFGIRKPGERVVYTTRKPPDDGLGAIARDLDNQ
jgi:hypothetical protein